MDGARWAATRAARRHLSDRMEATASDNAVLVAAQAGDEQAFVRLTAPHRQPLHRHCYRILGSLHDADDALQETMLRAWRGIDRFQPRAPLSSWLYRIATNVCLRMLEQRARDPIAAVDAHLEPYPDLLLDGVASPAAGPEEMVEERERIGLAFVAAMQLLPPKQRVTVVLRDVLDWSAREVAELLDDTVPAVNSALQRGRDRLQRERDERSLARAHAPANAAEEERVMRRFQEAWAAVDFDGIVSLLADDALLTMPPEALRFEGSAQIGSLLRHRPARRPTREDPARRHSRQRPARARRLRRRARRRRLRRLRRDGVRDPRRPDRRDHGLPATTRRSSPASASRPALAAPANENG